MSFRKGPMLEQGKNGVMAKIHYRKADVDGFKLFYREAGRGCANTASASRIPKCRPYVSRADPRFIGRLSHRCAGPARLRPVGHAFSRGVSVHLRQIGRSHRAIHRSNRARPLRDLRLRLRCAHRLSIGCSPSRAHFWPSFRRKATPMRRV